MNISPVSLISGHQIQVTLTYDGTTLTEDLVDLDDPMVPTFSTSYTVNIPAILGANGATVGFTGATGGAHCRQIITDFTYQEACP
jgi:hypothetical protein